MVVGGGLAKQPTPDWKGRGAVAELAVRAAGEAMEARAGTLESGEKLHPCNFSP